MPEHEWGEQFRYGPLFVLHLSVAERGGGHVAFVEIS
jgi:hypothetical protein